MDSSSSPPKKLLKLVDAEQRPSGDVGTSILVLNNDCLFHILSLLKLRELLRMENVCERFKNVAQMIYRTHHEFDLSGENCEDTPWTIEEATGIFCRVGGYIHMLKASEFCKSLMPFDAITWNIVPDFIGQQHFRNLRNIHLAKCNIIDQKSIDNMVAVCGNVKEVRFTSCMLTDDALISMLKLDQLEVLELYDYFQIRGEFLSSLTNIREITLETCRLMDTRLFVKFCQEHPNLQSLQVMGSTWMDWFNRTCVQTIATHLKGLEKLAIPILDPNISTSDCVALASLPKIKHFTLGSYGEKEISEQLLLNFSAHNRLDYLQILQVTITPNVAKALTKFTKLKVLNLNCCVDLNDSTLDLLSCTATLQKLHLHTHTKQCSVTASGLERLIARCPAIEFIDISGRHRLDDSCIPPILDTIKDRSHMLELIVAKDKFSQETLGKYIGNNAFKLKLSSTNEDC